MNIQTEFVALAEPLVSARVYAQGDAPPYAGTYITYFRVIKDEQKTLDANGGTGNLTNTLLQADVYSLSKAGAMATAEALSDALKAWAVTNLITNEQDFYEDDTKLHRVMLRISMWHY